MSNGRNRLFEIVWLSFLLLLCYVPFISLRIAFAFADGSPSYGPPSQQELLFREVITHILPFAMVFAVVLLMSLLERLWLLRWIAPVVSLSALIFGVSEIRVAWMRYGEPPYAALALLSILSAFGPAFRPDPTCRPMRIDFLTRLHVLVWQFLGLLTLGTWHSSRFHSPPDTLIALALAAPVVACLSLWPRKQAPRLASAPRPVTWSGHAFKIACGCVVLIPLFLVCLSPINHGEAERYLGPMWDVLHGKSLMYDNPTTRGFFSVWLSALILAPFGVSFFSFHLYTVVLNALFYLFIIVFIARQFRSRWIAVCLILPFLAIHSNMMRGFPFWRMSGGLPELVPLDALRIGPALIFFALLLRSASKRMFQFVGVIVAGSMFYSAELCILAGPAWLAVCVAEGWVRGERCSDRLQEAFSNIVYFLFSIGAFAGLLFVIAYRPSMGLPHLLQYLGDVFQALPEVRKIPHLHEDPPWVTFSELAARAVCIPGLALAAYLLVNRVASRRTLAFVFLLALNLGLVFQPFCWDSFASETTKVLLCILQLALGLRIMAEDLRLDMTLPRRAFTAPIVFAVFLILVIAVENAVKSPWAAYYSDRIRVSLDVHQVDGGYPKTDVPVLRALGDRLGEPVERVALCAYNELGLLLDAGCVNVLPSNDGGKIPAADQWREHYLLPALDRLEVGTLFIGSLGNEIPDELAAWFYLVKVDTIDDVAFCSDIHQYPYVWTRTATRDVYRIVGRRALPLALMRLLDEVRRAEAMGDFDRASEILDALEDVAPGNILVQLHLAAMLIYHGEMDTGLAAIHELVKRDSSLKTEAEQLCAQIAQKVCAPGEQPPRAPSEQPPPAPIEQPHETQVLSPW